MSSFDPSIRVLNFVTYERATFFQQQVNVLERNGVACTTLSLPEPVRENGNRQRSIFDYARFLPTALWASFGDFDLVHANYGLMAPFALAQPNLPVVLSLWGSDLLDKFGPLSQWCASRCDAVIVMSEEMATVLNTECQVIPHGVDLDTFTPRPKRAARADLGWDDDAKHVLFPYRPTRQVKDYPRAKRIVSAVRDQVDGPIRLQVATGQPHDRIPTFMNAADAMLLTSRREGSPNTIKEALACNLPIVATDVGDVRERLSKVEPSFVGDRDEDLVDALATVLDGGERSNGRETVSHLSVERMGERLIDVYQGVID